MGDRLVYPCTAPSLPLWVDLHFFLPEATVLAQLMWSQERAGPAGRGAPEGVAPCWEEDRTGKGQRQEPVNPWWSQRREGSPTFWLLWDFQQRLVVALKALGVFIAHIQVKEGRRHFPCPAGEPKGV